MRDGRGREKTVPGKGLFDLIRAIMAFYKKQKLNGKWYPRSLTLATLDTDAVAERLSRISTVSRADTYAVLLALGEVLGDMMESGYSVRLKGLGTFYLTGRAEGQGVDTPEEVTGRQFTKVHVRFIPEYRRAQNKKVTGRTLVPDKEEWIEVDMEK